MRFGDKLFFAMTAVLTVIFTVFGTWMLSSYFGQLLNREIVQIDTEGQMYQYMYEMAYQSLQDYGNEYAVDKAFHSVADSVEKEGVSCFAMSENGELLYGDTVFDSPEFTDVFQSLLQAMDERSTYACGIRELEDGYYLLYISVSMIAQEVQYLGICRDLSEIYEDRREAYYYIYSQGKRLESLSHKLLELVSLNRNELKKHPIRTRLLEEDIRATMRPIFRKKKIKGKVDLEGASLYGDRELLLSLLYNLMDNASKAVEEGGFVLLKGRKTGNAYEIKVVDNGRGIPKQEIARITEVFYMVDKSRSRKEGGAGIGLSLCKQIVELHEGIMEIVSNPGEGTVVRLIFPLVNSNGQRTASQKLMPKQQTEGMTRDGRREIE